jgi:hypothetical protein
VGSYDKKALGTHLFNEARHTIIITRMCFI